MPTFVHNERGIVLNHEIVNPSHLSREHNVVGKLVELENFRRDQIPPRGEHTEYRGRSGISPLSSPSESVCCWPTWNTPVPSPSVNTETPWSTIRPRDPRPTAAVPRKFDDVELVRVRSGPRARTTRVFVTVGQKRRRRARMYRGVLNMIKRFPFCPPIVVAQRFALLSLSTVRRRSTLRLPATCQLHHTRARVPPAP